MKVKVINKSGYTLPKYETENSAGLDLRFASEDTEPIILHPNVPTLFKTGLFLEIPKGYEAQIRPRSGLALKRNVTVLNSPGTIDADYRGEVGVILINHNSFPIHISHGERVAQMVFNKFERVEWDLVDTLGETERGEGGFGSTGKD